jgi:hypothetical protein
VSVMKSCVIFYGIKSPSFGEVVGEKFSGNLFLHSLLTSPSPS